MIIIKDVFGNIVCDVKSIYIDGEFNRIMVFHSWDDYTPKSNRDQITEDFDTQYKANRVIDWIFEQMKSQRGAANIIIDLAECPIIKDKDEGASIEELRF